MKSILYIGTAINLAMAIWSLKHNDFLMMVVNVMATAICLYFLNEKEGK
jgi:hypothetical protein